MQKQWTELKAWKYLEKRWSLPFVPDGHYPGRGGARILRELEWGLCDCIIKLRISGKISEDTAHIMKSHLRAYQTKRYRYMFWWPTTPSGSKRRARVCHQIVKKLGEPQ